MGVWLDGTRGSRTDIVTNHQAPGYRYQLLKPPGLWIKDLRSHRLVQRALYAGSLILKLSVSFDYLRGRVML